MHTGGGLHPPERSHTLRAGRAGGWQDVFARDQQRRFAVAYYFAHLDQLGRGVLVGLIPLAVVFTVAGRVVAGAGLEALRRRGTPAGPPR